MSLDGRIELPGDARRRLYERASRKDDSEARAQLTDDLRRTGLELTPAATSQELLAATQEAADAQAALAAARAAGRGLDGGVQGEPLRQAPEDPHGEVNRIIRAGRGEGEA